MHCVAHTQRHIQRQTVRDEKQRLVFFSYQEIKHLNLLREV